MRTSRSRTPREQACVNPTGPPPGLSTLACGPVAIYLTRSHIKTQERVLSEGFLTGGADGSHRYCWGYSTRRRQTYAVHEGDAATGHQVR